VERVLELANIAANKNTVPGDKSAFIPGGLRVGTPAMTTRGLNESDFEKVAEFIDRGVKLTIDIKKKVTGKHLINNTFNNSNNIKYLISLYLISLYL
jgi:glycine hydroxymethyltransferase